MTAPKPWPVTKCSVCPAAVIWTVTAKGKRMLVNAEPDPRGDVALVWHGDGVTVLSRVLTVEQRARRVQGTLRLSHFATCPRAAEMRSRR